jgi:predicted nucleic acid-binding protein
MARVWAGLMAGTSMDQSQDALIAAVAKASALTVATRNTKDFAAFGVPVFNPFTFAATK